MKTKLFTTLLAFSTVISVNGTASAQTLPPPPPPPLAGLPPIDHVILQLLADGSLIGNTGANRICGGMDDDQLHGNDGDDTITGDLGNDTLHVGSGASDLNARLNVNGMPALNGPALVEGPPVLRGLISDPLGIVGGSSTATANATPLMTSSQAPYQLVARPGINPGIESDPFGINGDEGNDLVSRSLSSTSSIIKGGSDTDFFTCDPMEEDAVFQLLTGLWGDGGTDSLIGPAKP